MTDYDKAEKASRIGCFILSAIGIAVVGLIAYAVIPLFFIDTQPAIVKQRLAEYYADADRKQSTRDSGDVPRSFRPGQHALMSLIASEVEKNLGTFKAGAFKRIANQTGCRLYNMIESTNSAELYLWSTKEHNLIRFIERCKLVGEINSHDTNYEITAHSEEGKTYYLVMFEVQW